ncbi:MULTISPECIES: chaperone NapD [Thalassobaculum]|uniref:Chaperone NapD n=1 Tax=Thalassobaculum litoreum DSM 18839 TaxID=1123362 RepID=A0A8G2BFB7_9PROT|nr:MULTISPECIES: chaperone NapD [Thalassobaculum]SDF37240.1 periplasmic nitrate reductase chaperone NapD [Thalassobaculum litoreum DSM 18839]
MSAECHIASLLIQCRPTALEALAATIGAEPGVEVPITDPTGTLIAMLESPDQGTIADLAHRFTGLAGVLSCNLVFHGIDGEAGQPDPTALAGNGKAEGVDDERA